MSQEYGAGGYVDPTEDMDPKEDALLCECDQHLNDNNGYDDENYLGELLQRRNRTKSKAPPPDPLYPGEEEEEDDEDENEDDENEEEEE